MLEISPHFSLPRLIRSGGIANDGHGLLPNFLTNLGNPGSPWSRGGAVCSTPWLCSEEHYVIVNWNLSGTGGNFGARAPSLDSGLADTGGFNDPSGACSTHPPPPAGEERESARAHTRYVVWVDYLLKFT